MGTYQGKSWGVVVLLAILILAGCSGGPSSENETEQRDESAASSESEASGTSAERVLKLGAAISLSGALAREGDLTRKGYEIWADRVNQEGGLQVGGERYRVEFIFYDDESDSTTAARLVERLITQDEVSYVFGPWGSGLSQATSAITEKYQVVTILPVANADPVYEQGFRYLFGIIPPASRGMRAHVDMLAAMDDPPRTFAVLTPDDLFPVVGAEGVIADIEARPGMEVVVYEKYPNEATDLSAVMTQVKNTNPDVILSPAYFEHNALTVRTAKDLRVQPKYIGVQGSVDIPDWIDTMGADGDYVVGYAWWAPDVQFEGPLFATAEEYTRAFEETFGMTPEFSAAAATAAGIVFQLAVERAGTIETEPVREAISQTDIQTFFGNIAFDETGKNIAGEAVLIQIQDGERVLVWPEEARVKEAVYPMPRWDER